MTDAPTPIVPPATIGMVGGGQLGKYALIAANAMGYRTVVLDPDPNAPAGVIAHEHLVAPFDDADALDRLALSCDVVTTEFENAPAASLELLAQTVRVAPSAACVAVAQDRFVEKAFMVEHSIAVGHHVAVATGDADALQRACELAAGGAVVKTARLGYDGKGQRRVATGDELRIALHELGDVDCIVESLLELRGEISVLVGRSANGAASTWPVAHNGHVDGILDDSTVPSAFEPAQEQRAVEVAMQIAEVLDYVGLLAVELFVVATDDSNELQLLVNEIAPRPHNSGHWTLDASVTSQFEQQIRSICGVGLGDTSMTAPAVSMVNLLGDLWFDAESGEHCEPNWAAALAHPDATLHLYGKAEPRRGRKMGHLTVTAATNAQAVERALALRDQLHG